VLANRTIVPKDEQSAPISGVARSIQSQPEASFALLCPDGTRVPLPEPLVQVLLIAAQAMTRKNAITMVVRSAWLTTQEAADMMGYSRQVVVDLIKKNKLKASRLGTHRRIKLADLVDFIDQEDKQRSAAMAKLVEHTEEFGGYDQDERFGEPGKAS
jgi:excisionase family DNA binding protein